MADLVRRLKLRLASLFSIDAQTERGAELAARGHRRESFRVLTKAARAGGIEAQYQVGRAYLRGDAVPPSPGDAIFWLEQAANAGLPEAQHFLAALAMQGLNHAAHDLFAGALESEAMIGRPPDYAAARFWAQQAADAGWAEAKALLACLYNHGPAEWHDRHAADTLNRAAAAADCPQGRLGLAVSLVASELEEDRTEARRELTAAASSGLPAANLMLGSLDAAVDPAAAAGHYRIAAEGGLPTGMLRYGMALLAGRGVARDPVAGEGWLRRAALGGEATAACLVADLYLGGDGLPPNLAEAGIWLRCGAERGSPVASRRLGQLCLRQGDRAEGANWLQKAAALGDEIARVDLAQLALAYGLPAQADLRAWLAAKAEAGDMAAAFNLGVCCAEAVGGALDETAALARFRQAASVLPAARYWLGRMKIEGRGEPQDLGGGRIWLERAAREGVVEAQLLAGEMMVNGRGGDRDVRGGYDLFKRLAATGHAGAQFSLGVLKAGGHGIPPDAVEALGHFRAAAQQGHPRAALMAGRYLAHGIGAPVNRIEAGGWLRRARPFHYDEAEQELARLREVA